MHLWNILENSANIRPLIIMWFKLKCNSNKRQEITTSLLLFFVSLTQQKVILFSTLT